MSIPQDPKWQHVYEQLQDELEAISSSATVHAQEGPLPAFGPYRQRVLFIASQEPAQLWNVLAEARAISAELNNAWATYGLDEHSLVASIEAILQAGEAALAQFTSLAATSRSGKYAESYLDGEIRAIKETYRHISTNVKKPRDKVKAFCVELKKEAGSRRWYPNDDPRHIPEDAAALAALTDLVKRMMAIRAKYDARTPKRSTAEDSEMVKELDACIRRSETDVLGKIAAARKAYEQKPSHADKVAARRKSKPQKEPRKTKKSRARASSSAAEASSSAADHPHDHDNSAYMGFEHPYDPSEVAGYYQGHEHEHDPAHDYGYHALGSSLLTPRKREIYRRAGQSRL